jgi:hypothetical protein
MKTTFISKLSKYAPRILGIFAILIQMCSLQTSAQAGPRMTETKENADALIVSLRAIVGESHEGVEIQLHGSCAIPDSEDIVVPPILWKGADGERDRAEVIRAALTENKPLSVARISPHVIVIRDDTVPQDLLETKIDSLNLTNLEQYSPEAAIAAAINSKAVQLALGNLRMRLAVSRTGLQHVNASGEPHLGRHVRNVTLSGVLSSILEQFGGFVLYEDCADSEGKRRFDIRYFK